MENKVEPGLEGRKYIQIQHNNEQCWGAVYKTSEKGGKKKKGKRDKKNADYKPKSAAIAEAKAEKKSSEGKSNSGIGDKVEPVEIQLTDPQAKEFFRSRVKDKLEGETRKPTARRKNSTATGKHLLKMRQGILPRLGED